MEMCYDGALVMPSSCALMSEDEMMYLEGGRVETVYGTAKYLAKCTGKYMAAWASLAGGWSCAAATVAATGIGAGVAALAGLGAGYCTANANRFRKAFNYFSLKNQKSKTTYYYKLISYATVITGIKYGKA